jgi:serine protease Do
MDKSIQVRISFSTRTRLIAMVFALLVSSWISTGKLSANTRGAMNGNQLALYAKPAVVRVLDGYKAQILYQGNNKVYAVAYGSMGSGVFISSEGHILTNAHVVQPSKAGEAEAKKHLSTAFFRALAKDLGEDLRTWSEEKINEIAGQSQFQKIEHLHQVALSEQHTFTFEIQAFGNPVSESSSADVAVIKIDAKNTPSLRLGDSDKVKDQDHISVIGFPGAANSPLLTEASEYEPSMTDGKISATGKSGKDGFPILQIDAAATHGNSGGPVVNDRGEIIGLLTFGGNGQVAGFTFVVPTSTAMKFVNEAKVNNQEGEVDAAYQQGLDYYFAKHYSAAIEKFKAVKQLFPQHTKVDRLIEDSHKEVAAGNDIPLPKDDADKTGNRQAASEPKARTLVNTILIGGSLLVVLLFGLAAYQKRQSLIAFFKKSLSNPPLIGRDKNPFAPSPPKPVLRGVAGFYAGNEIELDGNALVIGRDPRQSQLVIPPSAEGISSRHCHIRFDAVRQAVVLEDCGSTNGTYLASGERLQPGVARVINAGERFYLNDTQTMFELKSANGLPQALRPAPQTIPVIQGLQGAFAGQQVELNGVPVFIGRDPQTCQLVAPRSFDDISKRHCSLRFDHTIGAFWLEDYDSTNGTFVISGGRCERLSPNTPRRLNANENFYVGDPQNIFAVRVEQR